jgi:hypothetical protein
MQNVTTRNDGKVRRMTCGYTKRVDGINTARPPQWALSATTQTCPAASATRDCEVTSTVSYGPCFRRFQPSNGLVAPAFGAARTIAVVGSEDKADDGGRVGDRQASGDDADVTVRP